MELTLTLHRSIHEIAASEWDALARRNPFVAHGFLSALEDSGSVGRRTGWLPQHLALRDGAGVLAACAPCYAKMHSHGEYVFDHAWADAYERAGGRYYPKLQVAAPFSPVPGPRLLQREGMPVAALAQALEQACAALGASSVHATFCEEAEWEALGELGWLRRIGTQFHWHNRGYGCFDDFLGALSSRKRKQLKRERREVAEAGVTCRALRGAEIRREHWAHFNRFYLNTVEQRWGGAYLHERFWPLLGERLGDQVVLMWAEREGRPIAGALNLLGPDALHGRNWGCAEEVPFLHFELCYLQAIEWAIAHGLPRVEAGAQGEHKIQRGYLPVPTHSAHFVADRGLRGAIARFLDAERPAMIERMAALAEESPYKKEGEG